MKKSVSDTFLQLINEHVGIAHKVCRIYFPDADDRADAHQEMLYQLWRSYPGFDGRAKFSTWMYRVCLNTALTYRKKSQRHNTEVLSTSHHQIANPPAGDDSDTMALLIEAISTLSSVNKAIVLLYMEDMRYDEIAAITGLSRANVSVRLVRIKKELEKLLVKTIKPTENENA